MPDGAARRCHDLRILVRMPSTPPTALVTGATSGIGLELAHQLAERGHGLVLLARDPARLDEVADRLRTAYGVPVEMLPADLGDPADLARAEARLADPERPVDLLLNNAGYGLRERFLDNDAATEQRMLDVLVTAVLRLSHAALGAMVPRGRGGIINVSSVASFLPRGTYSAAKAWVNSFSRWAHHEYGPAGVRVMTLCPGFVKTDFHARMDVGRDSAPAWMWLEPAPLVREALADFDRGRAESIPSRRYRAIVTVTRLLPTGLLQRAQSLGRK